MGKEREYFMAFYDVVRAVSGTLDPQEVMDNIVNCVLKAMNVKGASIRILGRRKRRLLMGAHVGLSEGYVRKGPVTVEKSQVDREALEKNEVVYIKNVNEDPRWQYPEKAKEEGIVSVLVAPVATESDTIGILRVYMGAERVFDADEMMFLEAMARVSGIALMNAKLHHALKADYELLVADYYRIDDL